VADIDTEQPAPGLAQPAPAQPTPGPAQPAREQAQPSLYRRHRPRTFAEVVGQDAVVRTLGNAVARGQVHHAYLFVGSRGTGKTSMAKILAACLNCERGPTTEPCGLCDSCRAIAAARSLDVIEMDAASNNSVEDIRELRESVAFAPVSGRSKVYILDEAHMLSTAAWNAFLKTLEEPPPNTVFVLATTEAQKVPATVVDRCHRFDFRRPSVEQIAAVLRRAAEAESIAIPPEAVAAVARAATGSFRDALGTLEQLVTYCGARIALEDVLAVLGVTDAQLLEEIVDAVQAGDARTALLAVARGAAEGRDGGSLAADLEVRARELLVVATLGELPAELALTPDADARLLAQAGRVQPGTLVRLLEQLAAALEAVKAGADPRTQLELALVKAARPEVEASLRALLTRIERLESGVGGPADVAAPVAGGPAVAVAMAAGAAPVAGENGVAVSPGVRAHAPARAHTAPQSISTSSSPADAAGQSLAPAIGAAQSSSDFAGVPSDPGAAPAQQPADGGSLAVQSLDAGGSPAVQPADVVVESFPGQPADVESFVALWPAVVELIAAENQMLSAVIADARPVGLAEGELRVAFAATASFFKKKADDPKHRATVTEALRELTGDGRLRVEYELREHLPPPAGGQVEAEQPRSEEEWVARFVAELDAEELPPEWAPPPAPGS